MKRVIARGLLGILAVGILFMISVATWFQAVQARREFRKSAADNFWQIERIIESNESELAMVKEEFAENCIIRARAAAYIVQNYPALLENVEESRMVANLLQVDELHFFTPEGEIFAGTNPEYYGLTFDSGEQMEFFRDMLTDYSLELCQDITPNTAEKKLMQYAAVWSADREIIVQVGLEPERVMEAIAGNQISDIFNILSTDVNTDFYAVDRTSGVIEGSTRENMVGLMAENTTLPMELDTETETETGEIVYRDILFEGENYYYAAENWGNLCLVMMCPLGDLYHSIKLNTLVFTLCTMLIFLVATIVVFLFLDKRIVESILRVNKDLKKIEQGKWDTVVSENSLPEFEQLSGYINSMVESILDFSEKISKALEFSTTTVAICEYVSEKKLLTTTNRVREILLLTEEEMESCLAEPEKFLQVLGELFCPENQYEGNIYCLGKRKRHFVKQESFTYKNSQIYVFIDVTSDVWEKERLSEERDTDALTGLYNRRAFRRRVKDMITERFYGSRGVMVLIDLDNLKKVNDIYGHLSGDRYIRAIADILSAYPNEGQITARLGGDEFVLFLYDMEPEEIEATLERLVSYRGSVEIEMENGDRVSLEFSMGVARCPEETEDYNRLISLADERMYAEKLQRKQSARR